MCLEVLMVPTGIHHHSGVRGTSDVVPSMLRFQSSIGARGAWPRSVRGLVWVQEFLESRSATREMPLLRHLRLRALADVCPGQA